MNFNFVRQALGKLDGNYQIKIAVFGTPVAVGQIEYNQKNGKPFQQVTIQDDTGEQNKVKIFGDKMGDGCIGRRLAFEIAPNSFKGKMYYAGLWNDRANVAPAHSPVNAPQTSSDAKSPVGGGNIPPKSNQPDWDAKDLRMARECALKVAVQKQVIMAEISKDLTRVDSSQVIKWAVFFLNWIYTGDGNTEVDKQAEGIVSEPVDETPPDDTPEFP